MYHKIRVHMYNKIRVHGRVGHLKSKQHFGVPIGPQMKAVMEVR